MDWLGAQRPELVPRYEELYRRGAYAPHEERERLAADGAPAGGRIAAPGTPERVRVGGRRRAREVAHRVRGAAERGRGLRGGAGSPQRRRRRRSAALLSVCRAWALRPCRSAIRAPPSSRDGLGEEVRRETRERAAAARTAAGRRRPRRGRRSIACDDRVARRRSGERVPTPGGSLTSESAKMPASRMKPGKMHDTPTPCRAGRCAAQPRSRAGRTWWRGRAGSPGTAVLPAIEEMNTRCPRARSSIPRQERVRERDRRAQVDVERAVELVGA